MIRSTRPRLYDIDSSISLILQAVKGRSQSDLEKDTLLRYAVLHGLMIIAEAVRNLPAEDTGRFPDIPWTAIIGMGNHIKHEYHRLDLDIVWDAVTNHLRPLHAATKTMLADLTQPGLPL